MRNEYTELTRLIERLHRRFLDVLRMDLGRFGVRDINSVQALLLVNIGDQEPAMRDLAERWHYQSPNLSYNLSKLAGLGYVKLVRSASDRRTVRVRLTDKALAVVERIGALQQRLAEFAADDALAMSLIEEANQVLRRLERTWQDHLYGDHG